MKPLIIAEVAQAHDGSIALAHALVDGIADAGAGAVKFQARCPREENSQSEEWRVKPKWKHDESRYDYWTRTALTVDQLRDLQRHAEGRGLQFGCSVFSVAGAQRLPPGLVDFWKVPSGQITNIPLLRWLAEQATPIYISTGMCSVQEITVALLILPNAGLLECSSEYPTAANRVRLYNGNIAETDGNWFNGISDHSGTIWPSIAAISRGASVVEVHVRPDPPFGPDASSSITLAELKLLCEGAKFISTALENRETKDEAAARLKPMRDLFMAHA